MAVLNIALTRFMALFKKNFLRSSFHTKLPACNQRAYTHVVNRVKYFYLRSVTWHKKSVFYETWSTIVDLSGKYVFYFTFVFTSYSNILLRYTAQCCTFINTPSQSFKDSIGISQLFHSWNVNLMIFMHYSSICTLRQIFISREVVNLMNKVFIQNSILFCFSKYGRADVV